MSKKSKKKRIFPEYKQQGKKLVHPFKCLAGDRRSVGYVDDLLPELVWVALLLEKFGYKSGLGRLQKIVQIGYEVLDESNPSVNKGGSLVLSTGFSQFTESQKEIFVARLRVEGLLDSVQNCLAPLTLLYDAFPMRFIGPPTVVYSKEELVKIISRCIEKYRNKFDQPGSILSASATVGLWAADRIKYGDNVQIPDIEALVQSPESEKAHKAAAHFRASSLIFISPPEFDNSWAKSFWNHGYSLSPCELVDCEEYEMTEEFMKTFSSFVREYCENVAEGVHARWRQITPEIYRKEKHEVVGGLMARQANLAIHFAHNPGVWNKDFGDLILRCMIDCHILLAWILCDTEARSAKYVSYGLGRCKGRTAKFQQLVSEGDKYLLDRKDEIEGMGKWVDGQMAEWAVDVNFGSISGTTTRKMAQEADCEELYDFMYDTLSGAAHNEWPDICLLNMVPCKNPLHKGHRVPSVRKSNMHVFAMHLSAKYITMTYHLLDEKMGFKCDLISPLDCLHNFLDKIQKRDG